MHTGRRPSGLCGAALLVAARMHKFHRTVKDVISVVKVCQATLRKRLTEFEDTPTSQLTIDEFMKVDLEQECDPPSFTAGQHKVKMQQLEYELAKKLDEVEGEISCYKDEIETELEKSRPKLRGIYAAYTRHIDPEDKESVTTDPEEPNTEIMAQHLAQDFLCQVVQEEAGQEAGTGGQGAEPGGLGLGHVKQPAPLASILGKLSGSFSETETRAEDNESDEGELDLNGIDDQEIDKYILNDNEVEVKTALWMKQNEDYLQEQKEKEDRIQKEKEQGTYKEKPKKSRRRPAQIEALTATEAIERMLEKKKISSKINYDVLRDLNGSDIGSTAPDTGNTVPNTATSPENKSLKRQRSRKNKDSSKGLAATASSMGKRLRPLISNRKKKTASQVELSVCTATAPSEEHVPLPPASEPTPTEVPHTEGPHTEEEEEEDVEEEQCVSALKLIGDYGCEAEEEEVF